MDLIALLSSAPPWVRSVVSVLALLWALATLVTNALRAVPEARYVAVERAWPRLGQLLRAGRKIGTDVMPFVGALVGALVGRPVHEDTPPPPQPRAAERGSARPGALLVVVVLLWAGLAVELQGCPRLPPVSGCTPTSQRCGPSGHPEVCSASQRWEPAGDVSCAAVGGVCVLEAGVAHCAPAPSDGGAP